MKKGLCLLSLLLLFFSSSNVVGAEEERSWQDETIYYITIDRFNNSDFTNDFEVDAKDPNKFHGGDFQGIIDRLDYIKEMGFSVIALSSIFEVDGYKNSKIKDYFKTGANFGSMKKLQELVDLAHQKKMKVILDFPIMEGMDQNTLIDVAKWWIEEAKVDGYILDLGQGVSPKLLQNLSREAKEVKEDFIILADFQTGEQVEGIDGFFDYSFNENLRAAFSKSNQSLQAVATNVANIKPVHFLDNQHTHRFTRDIINLNEHPGPRWKLALTYLYTTPGIPFVFYGSEIALDGGEEPDNQRQMDFRTDKDLIDYLTNIAAVREKLPALRRGSFELLYENQGMVVYKREYKGETAVVAINNTTKSQAVTLTSELEDGKELRGLLNGDLVKSEDGAYKLIVDRDEAEIYVLAEKSGLNIPLISTSAAVVILFLGFLFLVKKRSRNA